MDDAWLDAVELASRVRAGEVSPVELVQAAIDRIEARNSALNAVVTTAFDRALSLARSVDLTAPFAGVPFLIKDQLDWAGVRTTHGSAFHRDSVAVTDSPIVRRYLAAGLIPLGKTNVPECGLLATTEPLAYGATGNPWDCSRTAGGSSGGSASAVAAGMVPVATGSDGGGSIRIPSGACGLFGLKPTRGRTPGSGWGGLTVTHVLTRTVRDSAAMLDVTCGPVAGDVTPLPPPTQPFVDLPTAEPRRLRIAVSTLAWEGVRYSSAAIEANRRTADLLSNLGHEIIEDRPHLTPEDFATLVPLLGRIVPAAIARTLESWERATGQPVNEADVEPLTWEFAQEGRAVTATQLLEAFEAQAALAEVVSPFFSDYDAWLLPTLAEPAPFNGEWKFSAPQPRWGWLRMTEFVPPLSTALANYTGQPAMSVPLGQDADTGLPMGSQFYGRWGDEAMRRRYCSSPDNSSAPRPGPTATRRLRRDRSR